MKKVLALSLALIMLVSLTVATVAAEDEKIDLATFWFDQGRRNIYLGDAVSTPPTLDGVINEDEYTYTKTETVGSLNIVEHDADTTEWMAYDEDYFYYAFSTKLEADKSPNFQFKVGSSEYTLEEIYARAYVDRYAIRFAVEDDAGLVKKQIVGNWKSDALVWDDTVFIGAKRDITNQTSTFELKISMEWIKKDAGDDPLMLSYTTYLGGNSRGDNWIQSCLSTMERIAILDAGVSPPMDWTYFNVLFEEAPEGYYTTTQRTTTVFTWPVDHSTTTTAPVVTAAPPAKTTTAATTKITIPAGADWETINNALGFNIYVGAPTTTPPCVNGMIGVSEYTASRTIALEDLYGGDGDGEIQGERVTEFFAHDEEFIYYGVEFTQAEDNRALIPQFKVDNTFDIYNAEDASDYLSRVTHMARLLDFFADDGSNVYNAIIPQEGYRAPEIGRDIFVAATKDIENLKQYEFKISKAYFAEVNNIDISEIRVIPYFTTFHGSSAIVPAPTAEINAILEDAGATFTTFTPNAYPYYNFMVLDVAPTAVVTTTDTPDKSILDKSVAEENPDKVDNSTTAATTILVINDCKSSISMSALIMIPTLVGGVILTSKKRKDD